MRVRDEQWYGWAYNLWERRPRPLLFWSLLYAGAWQPLNMAHAEAHPFSLFEFRFSLFEFRMLIPYCPDPADSPMRVKLGELTPKRLYASSIVCTVCTLRFVSVRIEYMRASP